MGAASWPVAVVPVGKIACATVLWRAKKRLHVTVVVKARFRFEQNDHMTLADPVAMSPQEGELAPYLGQADVVISRADAHACGPQAVPVVAVKLALYRDWAVIDKNLLVYAPGAGHEHAATPFERAAIVQPDRSEPLGVVVDPHNPGQAAGFGPWSVARPERQEVLAGQAVPRSRDDVVDIPDMFPWSFFQVAPADQRTSFLRGDEWVLLDGMDPSEPRLQSRLPCASALVRVYPPDLRLAQGPCYQVAMQADRLSLDVSARQCTVLWRGSFPVADVNTAHSLVLVASLSVTGQAPVWPSVEELLRSPVLLARGLGEAATRTVSEDQDSMADTNVREDASALGALRVVRERLARAAAGGSPSTGPTSRRLALSSQGVVAVEESMVDKPLTLPAQTEESGEGLVPAEMPGMPWSERRPAQIAAPQGDEEAGRAPLLAELSVIELRQQLSDSIDEDSCDELRWTLTD